LDGILNIDKPWGKTSFSIVSLVKRLTGERRVGHAGSLDPAATGVLPVCLGRGTRVVEFLMEATKVYRAQIELGVTTDTYDASGNVVQRRDPSGVSQRQLESALASFCGLIQQTPPMYSAVRYHGKHLYELARAGIEVERKSRPAKIHYLELIDFTPPLVTTEVMCGKGTYIRSLAYELGELLGCGANLKSLVRLKCGPFRVEDAVSLPQLEDAFRCGYWHRFVYPIDAVLLPWAAMIVGDDTERIIKSGCPLSGLSSAGNHCRVYTPDGYFLGVLRFDVEKEKWQPDKIFPSVAEF
jgi:tRNA pseudouridine55 synthase